LTGGYRTTTGSACWTNATYFVSVQIIRAARASSRCALL
jgi:hypothetical protein